MNTRTESLVTASLEAGGDRARDLAVVVPPRGQRLHGPGQHLGVDLDPHRAVWVAAAKISRVAISLDKTNPLEHGARGIGFTLPER